MVVVTDQGPSRIGSTNQYMWGRVKYCLGLALCKQTLSLRRPGTDFWRVQILKDHPVARARFSLAVTIIAVSAVSLSCGKLVITS